MSPSRNVVDASDDASTAVSIDPEQTLKASKALLAHIKKASQEGAETTAKSKLLEDPDDDPNSPIWLTLTTKRHISDKNRLKPGKIPLPHSLNTDDSTIICVITADPQRVYKNIIDSDEFPADLRKRITRIIDYTKLKAKYKSFEAQRKLFSEHDIFVADDRIINRLPKVMGKTFFKTTQKRPIPVIFHAKRSKDVTKAMKRQKAEKEPNAAPPAAIAKEIQKAVTSALVSLAPTTNTAVRIGYSTCNPRQIADNVTAVVPALVEKWVPQKWRNVKSIYIKGSTTAALPIWLTKELWLDGSDIVADEQQFVGVVEKARGEKKRKRPDNSNGNTSTASSKKVWTLAGSRKAQVTESDDSQLNKQIADRKAKLKRQKEAAKKSIE